MPPDVLARLPELPEELEYRFVGEQVKTKTPLAWAIRNNGLMLHCPDPKTMTRDQDFPISIEVQLLGGLDDGKPRSTANLCTPGTDVVMDGKIVPRHCTNSKSKTYHGDRWVTVEIEVRGNKTIKHIVDGQVVLAYSDSPGPNLVNNLNLVLQAPDGARGAPLHPVLEQPSQEDEREDEHAHVEVEFGPQAAQRQGDGGAVEVGRAGADGDERVHVGHAGPPRVGQAPVEPGAGDELDRRGHDEHGEVAPHHAGMVVHRLEGDPREEHEHHHERPRGEGGWGCPKGFAPRRGSHAGRVGCRRARRVRRAHQPHAARSVRAGHGLIQAPTGSAQPGRRRFGVPGRLFGAPQGLALGLFGQGGLDLAHHRGDIGGVLRLGSQASVTRETASKEAGKDTQFVAVFTTGGAMHYTDAAKDGELYVTPARELDRVPELRPEGIDPLADQFTWHSISRELAARKQPLKTLLTDESFIIGLGDLYSDEILYHARIHPATPVGSALEW